MSLTIPPVWQHVATPPNITADIRTHPDDFQVVEQLGFNPTGSGEHVLLQIQKRGSNTEWVARQIARFAQVKTAEVSYAGLKDRHALTTQWFSVRLGKQPDPDWSSLNCADFKVLTASRHQRKLRRGSLVGNDFQLILRNLPTDSATALEQRLQRVQTDGIPNYFGSQRFGHDYQNLVHAAGMLEGSQRVKQRHQRSLYLSAARALLFNEILSLRVQSGHWNQAMVGDVMQLAGSNSVFVIEAVTPEIVTRLAEVDIHPTAPLWGQGASMAQQDAAEVEQQVLTHYSTWCEGLAQAGLEQTRRPLRTMVPDLTWQWQDAQTLHLCFSLSAGTYATSVLRELVNYTDSASLF